MATDACRNCRYSKSKVGRDTPYLFYRRYPPTRVAKGESYFPLVEWDEWCGEWMAMRPGAGLPAGIAPRPRPTRGKAAVELGRRHVTVEGKP